SALRELGVKPQNVIILADIDKKEGTHYELMEKTILDFEHKFKKGLKSLYYTRTKMTRDTHECLVCSV
ncbi:hypothetical protein ACTPEF_26845, partial [Clostridioides difficile]